MSIQTKPIKTKDYFPGYIGQPHVTSQANEELTLEAHGFALPLAPEAFTGLAGLGKTKFAEAYAAARSEIHGGEHRLVMLNAAMLTCGALVSSLVDNMANRPSTLFIDEAASMSPKIRNILKSIIETNGEIKDVTLGKDIVFPANPFQQKIIFASNEDIAAADPALFGADGGRCRITHFEKYNTADKKALIRLGMGIGDESVSVKIDADAVEFLEKRLRGNARKIVGNDGICNRLRRKAILANGKVTLKLAQAYCRGELAGLAPADYHKAALYPGGLEWSDISLMRYLNGDVRGKQVADCANFLGIPRKDASDKIQWLVSEGMLQTLANCRKALAQGGANYLATLDKMEKAVAAAKGRKAGTQSGGNLPLAESASIAG